MKHRSKRDTLNVNVRVLLPGETVPIGHIMDLSMGGLSLSGHGTPLPAEVDTLELLLPWVMHGQQRLILQVARAWLEYTDTGRWHAGYRILRCPDESQRVLEHLAASFADI